ncbi:hypothetical protein [Nocardiopsis sp. CC223A]|uniref:hypothetical protein n=1 Tax=Nocardiopsis sp. CC223A TaxID=3044051 RepID=UPI00278C7B30|nr:hypothetical protein [Nocardiopsis sp. CC223A]
MHIRILCRTCMGTGRRAAVTARLEDDHTLTQVLLAHPCTDCDAHGHTTQTATVHPDLTDPPDTAMYT